MDLYRMSIKDHRTRIKNLLRENERCYASLNNKDSYYARQVFALQKLHREVYEIYKNAPDDFETDDKPEKGADWIEYPKGEVPKLKSEDIVEVEYDGGSIKTTTVENANWNMVDRFRFIDKS